LLRSYPDTITHWFYKPVPAYRRWCYFICIHLFSDYGGKGRRADRRASSNVAVQSDA